MYSTFVFSVVFAVLCLLHLLGFWRKTIASVARLSRPSACPSSLWSCGPAESTAKNDLERHARKYKDEISLARAKSGMVTSANICIVAIIVSFVRQRVILQEGHVDICLVLLFAGHLTLCTSHALEGRMTQLGVKCIYSLLMSFALTSLFFCEGVAAPYFCLFTRLYLSQWVHHLGLSIFWNVAFSVTAVAVREATGGEVVLESFWALLILIVAREAERSALIESRCAVEVRASKSERMASNALLNAMCDVVVPLNEGLKIAEHVPKLSAMLLHSGGCASLEGRKLDSFLYSAEDQQRFCDIIRRPVKSKAGSSEGTSVVAEVFYSRMRDSTGNVLNVELLAAQFLDLDGHVGHLVGIREHFEEAANLSPISPMPNASPNDAVADAGVDADDPETLSSVSGSVCTYRSEQLSANDADHGRVILMFEAISFEILYFSRAFAVLCGVPEDGLTFLRMLDGHKLLLQHFQDTVQSYTYHKNAGRLGFKNLRLRPPHAVFSGVEFTVALSFTFTSMKSKLLAVSQEDSVAPSAGSDSTKSVDLATAGDAVTVSSLAGGGEQEDAVAHSTADSAVVSGNAAKAGDFVAVILELSRVKARRITGYSRTTKCLARGAKTMVKRRMEL